MRRPITLLAALSAALLVATSSAFVVLNAGSGADPTVTSASDIAAVTRLLEACAGPDTPVREWENCVQPKVGAAMEAYGPASVVSAIYSYSELRSNEPEFNCHQLMHEVGRDVVGYIPEITAALALGQLACQVGFQHGIIEQSIDEADSMAAVTGACDSIVADTTLPPFIVGECYHAVGHGVIKRNNYEYRNALRDCEEVITKAEIQLGCVGGVIMTWSNSLDTYRVKNAEIPEDLRLAPYEAQWEACQILTKPAAREGCLNFTAEKVAPNVEAYKKFGKFCKDVMGIFENCLFGVGRVQGGRSPLAASEPGKPTPIGLHSIENIVANCDALAGALDQKMDGCLIAAAASRPNFDPSPGFIEKLCAAARTVPCATLQASWDNSTRPRNA